MKPNHTPLLIWFSALLLLLCHFALRTHHIDVQQPYVDEGFHLRRALVVWDFAHNPGRFAHGKVLVYFWMGLFEGSNTPLTILPVARLSIALFSVLTGAALYRLGCALANWRAGLLAMAVYAVMPLAFFYERMAMADPLAAGLMALAAWRCLVFARRPSLAQGALIGLLLGLTTLAKLTMGGVILLPFVAILLYGKLTPPPNPLPTGREGESAPANVRSRKKRLIVLALNSYGLPLLLAFVVGFGLWLPMLIPALAAHGTPNQFILVNDTNIARSEEYFFKPLDYLQRLLPLLAEFVAPAFLAGAGMAALIGGVGFWWINRRLWRSVLFLLAWLALMATPAFFIARLTTTRYFMPTIVPVVLLIAVVVTTFALYQRGNTPASSRFIAHGSRLTVQHLALSTFYLALSPVLIWFFAWVLPFAQQMLTNPHALPFTDTNRAEYVAGYFLGDDAVQAAAAHLNSLPPRPIYATWNLCHLIFFYVEQDITCLPEKTPRRTLETVIEPRASDEPIYFVMADYEPFWDRINNARYEKLGEYPRRLIKRPVYVLELWRKDEN